MTEPFPELHLPIDSIEWAMICNLQGKTKEAKIEIHNLLLPEGRRPIAGWKKAEKALDERIKKLRNEYWPKLTKDQIVAMFQAKADATKAMEDNVEQSKNQKSDEAQKLNEKWIRRMRHLEDGDIGAGSPDHPLRKPETEIRRSMTGRLPMHEMTYQGTSGGHFEHHASNPDNMPDYSSLEERVLAYAKNQPANEEGFLESYSFPATKRYVGADFSLGIIEDMKPGKTKPTYNVVQSTPSFEPKPLYRKKKISKPVDRPKIKAARRANVNRRQRAR